MNLTSMFAIFGDYKNVNELFNAIFSEKIENCYNFQSSWDNSDSDYSENSKTKAISRLCDKPHAKFGKNLKRLFQSLNDVQTTKQIVDNIDSILPKEHKIPEYIQPILESLVEEITHSLPDKSNFSTTLKILVKKINLPETYPILLYWIIIYCIFGEFCINFQDLYNITNMEAYKNLYSNIVTGEDIIKHYNEYNQNYFDKKIMQNTEKNYIYVNTKNSRKLNLDEDWKYATKISISSVALPSILTPQINNGYYNQNSRKVLDKKVNENCQFRFIFCKPQAQSGLEIINTCMVGDMWHFIDYKLIETSLYEVSKIMETSESVKCKTLDIRIPYSIMIVENDSKHRHKDYIKIDLYTPYISSENRIHFKVYKKDKDLYNFFIKEFENRWLNGNEINLNEYI